MKGLILKDLLNMKSSLKMFTLMVVIYAVVFIPQGNSSFMAGFTILISTILIVTTMAYDDTAKWDKYALTMPLTRKDIVLSKYLVMICFSVIGAVVGVVFTLVAGIFQKNLAILATLLQVGIILSVALIFGSLLLPLMYKFGVEKARLIMILCALLPTGVVILLSQFFKNSATPVISEDLLLGILYATPIIAIAALVLSFLASVHIYKKKEF